MEQQPAPPEQPICTIGILLPVVGLPMLLVGAVWSLLRGRLEARLWRRRLLALAAVDLLVAASLVLFLRTHWSASPEVVGGPVAVARSPSRRVIGIRMDPTAKVEGVRVQSIMPNGPAARAGLAVGDVVIAVDGAPVGERRRLPELLQAKPAGERRTLRLRRGGRTLEKGVVPVTAASLERAGKPGIFEITPTDCGPGPLRPGDWGPLVGAVAVLLGLGLLRRIRPLGLWVAVAALPLTAMTAGLLSVFGLCAALGGRSLGVAVVGMIIGEGLLLAGSLWTLRRLRSRGMIEAELLGPRLSLGRSVGLGAGYMLGGGLRLGLLIAGGGALVTRLQAGADALGLQLSSHDLGPAALGLLFLLGVVLGPAAEELYFRGVLLPWLAHAVGARWALWISAALFGALHLHYGVSTLMAALYGFVLGWARARSGGLWAPFILHASMNLLAGWALVSGR